MFESMFGDDPDFQRLVPIAPAIINEMKEDFRDRFDVIVKELKHFQLKKSKERADEIASIERSLNAVKGASDKICMQKIEAFQHEKKQVPYFTQLLKIVVNSRNAKEVDEALKTLRDNAQKLSDQLMEAEITMLEQFEEVLKEFERSYMELCSSCNEFGQSSFSRLRELENEHNEKFTEAIVSMCERFSKGDIEEVDDDIRDVSNLTQMMGDRDILMNVIVTSHDFRIGKIDMQEDVLVTGIAHDQDQVIRQVQADEIKRNRDRVGEIIAFLEKTSSEIEAAEDNAY